MVRNFLYMLLAAAALCAAACNKSPENNGQDNPVITESIGLQTMKELWKTSPAVPSSDSRFALYGKIQGFADALSSKTFSSALSGSDAVYRSLVKSEDIMACYDAAFDRVLDGIKNEKPANGETYIWFLYNMGYVVKTPSGCFGIDIYHRRAEELAPYIDFYASTHVHQDHKSDALISAMKKAGKPIVTNYLDEPGNAYTSTVTKDYQIGNFALHTFITNHNNGSTNVPVTVFQVSCGENAGNLVIMHSGDSNFRPEQFDVTADVDVYILRYAPNELTENNVVGKIFSPKYALLSHILELSHADPSASRWTLAQGLDRAAKIDCKLTYMPFWGDKMVWKNGKLE